MNSISNNYNNNVSSTEKIFIRKLENRYHSKDITISKIARSILDLFALLFTSNKKIKVANTEVSDKYRSLANLQQQYKGIDPIQQLKRGITKDGISHLKAHYQIIENSKTPSIVKPKDSSQEKSIVLNYLAYELYGKAFDDIPTPERFNVLHESQNQSVKNAHLNEDNAALIIKIPNWSTLNDNEKFLLLKMNQKYQHDKETDFSSIPFKEKIAENKQLLLLAIKHISPKAFLLAQEPLKNDSDFLLEAIKANAAILDHVGENWKKNDGFMLGAIKVNAEAFKFADPSFKGQSLFKEAAKQNNPKVAEYLP